MPADATLEDVWKLFRETEQQMKETDRRMSETDRRMSETDRRMSETDRKLREMSANVDRAVQAVADLTGKWGKFVEAIVAAAGGRLFAERGIPVHQVQQRTCAWRDGRTIEIDALVVNDAFVVVIEAKSTLKVQDVRDHLERLVEFKTFFPQYAGRKVLGAVAGMVIEEESDKFAYRQGLFVIGPAGDSVRLLNDPGFVPKAW